MSRTARRWSLLSALLLSATAGCADETSDEPEPPVAQPVATAFDPARTTTITGRVMWSGPTPIAAPFIYGVARPDGNFDIREIQNPNTPRIHADSRAVAGAVVFLRGIDPATAKPWDLPPARVELKDRDITVVQGGRSSRAGFVRRGDVVTVATAGPEFHVLRARGAAFFSLPFPEPGKELTRTLGTAGRVELSSGAGYYWATASLFVDDHPYYTLSDADGRFTLTQVPAGSVEVVVWLPNWAVARQERDPESGLITRQTYGPPFEVVRRVVLTAGTPVELTATLP